VLFTEEGTKKRASLHVVGGATALRTHDRGGLEVLDATAETFREALLRENHTVKRALTDPRLFSGIGNAYSDEILHAARLSPLKLTRKLTEADMQRLFEATRATLELWTNRLRQEVGAGFPEKVTAFRDGMAVHGRFGQPCPVCAAPVQRIVYTLGTRRTIVPAARRTAGCWPTAVCPGCSRATGHAPSRSWSC
jgi:formamidopyrimidine-DNA glycosylase